MGKTEKNCKTCLWWVQLASSVSNVAVGSCTFLKSLMSTSKTGDVMSIENGNEDTFLLTGGEFGCNHHTPDKSKE